VKQGWPEGETEPPNGLLAGGRRARAKKPNVPLVWWLVGGGVLLVAGVVLAFALSSPKGPAKPAAPASGGGKDAPGKDAPEKEKAASPAPPKPAGKAKELLVGKWESTEGEKDTLQFNADGSLVMGSAGIEQKGTYRLLGENEMEVTTELDGKKETEKKKFTVTKDELKTTDAQGQPYRFKRVDSGIGKASSAASKAAGKAPGKR
jgi:uncharacterized protein (TIGR03066 family)